MNNQLIINCISMFGVHDANCVFPMTEEQTASALLVTPATYAWLKNQEIEHLNTLSNVDLTKSSEEISRMVAYHQGALNQVRSMITAIEIQYQQSSIEGSN